MRRILSLVAICAIAFTTFGQAPEGFKYQALVRDNSGTIMANQAVGVQMTVQQGNIGGTAVYQETFLPTTSAFGLVNLEIGTGTTTDDFTTIDWSAGPYFIETAIDAAGGTNYAVMGTSKLMSVPYALYAKTSGSSTPGPQGATGPSGNDGQGGVTQAGTNVTITGAGTGVDPYVVNATNELQTLSVSAAGDTLYLQNGGFVIIPGISAANNPTAGLAIGDSYQGGIVFYLDVNGGGLIAAPSDQSTGARWGCSGTTITGADGTGIGAGAQNTIDIESGCTTSGTAADICANLTLDGYSDWFLPSKDELNEMFQNIGNGNALGLGNIGGFTNNYYWSSTENGNVNAWVQNFYYSGSQSNSSKSNTTYVRAVRAF
jgi:hypothetical protein